MSIISQSEGELVDLKAQLEALGPSLKEEQEKQTAADAVEKKRQEEQRAASRQREADEAAQSARETSEAQESSREGIKHFSQWAWMIHLWRSSKNGKRKE